MKAEHHEDRHDTTCPAYQISILGAKAKDGVSVSPQFVGVYAIELLLARQSTAHHDISTLV
jgi:hypothetical protein